MNAIKIAACVCAGALLGAFLGSWIDPLGAIIANIVAFLATLWLNPENRHYGRSWHYELGLVVAMATTWGWLFVFHLERFR